MLKDCLNSIKAQSLSNFELIVVDDASTDGTADYLKSIKDRRLRVVSHKQNKNIAYARNSGIKAAKTGIIVFIDDDCVASKDWLKILLSGFTNKNIGFVIGSVIYNHKGYKGSFPERLIHNMGAKNPGGANIAYKKKVFEKAGMFDVKNFPDYHEDKEMGIRAIKNGFKFERRAEAIVYHQKTYWTAKSLIRSSKAVSAWPRMKKKHPNHYQIFETPFIKKGALIHPEDYLLILASPILVPILFVRFVKNGNRNYSVFFAKWPLFFILRRYYILSQAIKQRVLMF
jgi:GT2 family glycosyltransferase